MERTINTKYYYMSQNNSVGIQYKIPRTIPSKADVVFTAISTAAGTAVSGTFLLQLYKPV